MSGISTIHFSNFGEVDILDWLGGHSSVERSSKKLPQGISHEFRLKKPPLGINWEQGHFSGIFGFSEKNAREESLFFNDMVASIGLITLVGGMIGGVAGGIFAYRSVEVNYLWLGLTTGGIFGFTSGMLMFG